LGSLRLRGSNTNTIVANNTFISMCFGVNIWELAWIYIYFVQ